ncbi:hypothetical protein SLEP1_g50586 [Rubroshorea leprosula]|uniref:Wall-associated receptor kinase galacturonan-binding domain-containing protein n=1 Tax=Rubroshorea leprosula TaxID=152421 RepID=A0AAV5M3Y8_9ROSI|nr:hypothetical protein SLEP1_g50586 [Rubroshorea leprosula]
MISTSNGCLLFPLLSFHYHLHPLICTPIAYCNDDDDVDQKYLTCKSTYNCGILKDIGYPFWGNGRPQFCGHQGFELLCEEGQYSTMHIGGQKYQVLNISHSTAAIMTIVPIGIWGQDACPEKFINVSLSQSLFTFAPSARNLYFFYGCPPQIDNMLVRNIFNCTIDGGWQCWRNRVENLQMASRRAANATFL